MAARIGGLVPIRIPARSESGMSAFLHPPCRIFLARSRTLVMHSALAPFYRFFLHIPPNSLHGPSFSTSFSACRSASISVRSSERAQNASVEACGGVFAARLPGGPGGVVVAGFGGQCRRPAQPGVSGLLLHLCAGACPRRLRKNVRAKEVCGALVGDYVRQATRSQPDQQLRWRAALAARGSRRARAALALAAVYTAETPRIGRLAFPRGSRGVVKGCDSKGS